MAVFLSEQNLRYLGYTANPISQSGQHEHQKVRVARVLEIETKRGLTVAESIAKHKEVRTSRGVESSPCGGTLIGY